MEIGQIIALRRYSLGDASVELLIGIPYPEDDGQTYFCPFQVNGLGDEEVRRSGGVDSLQALILGIERAATYLSTIEEVRNGQLEFLGESGIGFGLSA